MARLTYSYIFTNVHKYDETGSYTGLQIASKLNQKNGQNSLFASVNCQKRGLY